MPVADDFDTPFARRLGEDDGVLVSSLWEQAVLGAVLMAPECLEKLPPGFGPHVFAVEDHGAIFEAAQAAAKSGSTYLVPQVEAILPRLAGPQGYIRTLPGAAISFRASDVAGYAQGLISLYQRRSLVHLADMVKREAMMADDPQRAPAASIAARAAEALDRIAASEAEGKGSVMLGDAVTEAIAAGEAAALRDGRLAGISSGFGCFDQRLGGLEGGAVYVLGARPAMGKAQPLDAKVLRADGSWARMGDLRLGDTLASIDGAQSRVSGVFPQGVKPIYRISFSDGRSTECCADHFWSVHNRKWPKPRVMTTAQIASLIEQDQYRRRLSIDLVSGHFGQNAALPIDPWLLGALIGNGSFMQSGLRFSTASAETLDAVKLRMAVGGSLTFDGRYTYTLVGQHELRASLVALGLWGSRSEEKFIPEVYKRADRESRLQLLRGLLDTDGWVEKFGAILYSTSSRQLAEDVRDLVRSLGGVCRIRIKTPFYTHKGERRQGLQHYVCGISHPYGQDLLTVGYKRDRAVRVAKPVRLTVQSVEYVRDAEARCIAVTHPSRLYVTDGYIVTHNTALAVQMAMRVAQTGLPVLFVSLEMQARQIGRRALALASRVKLRDLRSGDFTRCPFMAEDVVVGQQRLAELPLLIEDEPSLTAQAIALRAKAAIRKFGSLGLVVIDHLHIMGRPESAARFGDTQAITEISGGVKRMAKELDVPVLLLAQLNRRVEGQDDKRPSMADLRQSGAVEQDAEAVGFLYRPEYYLARQKPEDLGDTKFAEATAKWQTQMEAAGGRAEVIWDKVRDGETGVDDLRFDGERVRFFEEGEA
jgi:replicative DNA helicase